jgi:hypothetical protein
MESALMFGSTDLWNPGVIPLDCQVLERRQHESHQGHITYVVRVFYQDTWRGRAGIPRDYIRLIETKGYQTPFRHEMQLPDAMVPEKWRDLK